MESPNSALTANLRLAVVTGLLAALLVGLADAAIGLTLPGPKVEGVIGAYILAILGPTLLTGMLLAGVAAAFCIIGASGAISLRGRSLNHGVLAAGLAILALLEWANLTLFDGPDISSKWYRTPAEWALRLAILPIGVAVMLRIIAPALARAAGNKALVRDRLLGWALMGAALAAMYANAKILHLLYDFIHLQEVILAFLLMQAGLTLATAGTWIDGATTGRRAVAAVSLVVLIFAGAMVARGSDDARRARGAALARARALPFHSGWSGKILDLLSPLKTLDSVDVSDILDRIRRKEPSAIAETLDAALPNRNEFNLLWISFDTLRGDRCGFNGYGGGTTPNLDRLAKEAFVFTRAQSTYPTSNYSYSSALTSLYPRITPVYNYAKNLDREYAAESTLPGLLSSRGWHTVGITAFNRETSRKLSWFGSFREGFDSFNPDQEQGAGWAPKINASVLKSMRARPKDRPYFLWAHYIEPHAPYVRHEGYPAAEDEADLYDREIEYTDAQLGELLAILKAEGQLDNTVIMFFSDHGEAFGEHDAKYHNSTVYQTQVHVPLFVLVPGLRGRTIDTAVSLVDMLPTFTDLAGVQDNQRRLGRSLVPMMLDETGPHEGFSYSEVFHWLAGRHARDQRALVHGHHKIITRPYQDAYEIYDLSTDPGETESLVGTNQALEQRLLSLITAMDSKIDSYFGGAILTPEEQRAAFEADIDSLIGELKKKSGTEQVKTYAVLERTLLTAYNQPQPEARRHIGESGIRDALERVRALYPRLAPGTASRFLRTLGFWSRPEFIPFLKEQWSSAPAYQKFLAGWALAMGGDPSASVALAERLDQQTAIALGHLGDSRASPWLLHNLWESNRPILYQTLRALPGIQSARDQIAHQLRARVTSGVHMGYEIKTEALNALEGSRSPDTLSLASRFLADGEEGVRKRARAVLKDVMSPADITANAEAAQLELAGDLAFKNMVYLLAVSRYNAALSRGTLYNSHLRLRKARAQKLAGRKDDARVTLEEVAANSDVPEDRVTARKRIGQLESPFRIATQTFRASVDEAGIRLNSSPKARTAFRVSIPIKNDSPAAWHGGAWRFGVKLELVFIDAAGKRIPSSRQYLNWLPEGGIDAGESATLDLMGIAPPPVKDCRMAIRVAQEWGKFDDDGIFYIYPHNISLQ